MSEKVVTPFFLTEEIAKVALSFVGDAIEAFRRDGWLKRLMYHIVILAPSMKDDREADYPDYPDYPLRPHVLAENGEGDPSEWPHKFDNIARCKALQLWTGRNDGRTDSMAHLLFPGDTPWWGGVKRDGIVVACSGFQPHFDRMFAGMVADMCIALACDEKAKWMETHKDDFLP